MNTPSKTPSPFQSARPLLKELAEKFAVFRECKPLAIGIDKQLLERMPEIDRKVLRMALRLHTGSVRYLKEMSQATARFDLDGNAAGEVPETHRTHATETLRERFRKEADQRRAQRAAEEAERAAQEAEKQRAEKLNQLAAKFSRTK